MCSCHYSCALGKNISQPSANHNILSAYSAWLPVSDVTKENAYVRYESGFLEEKIYFMWLCVFA